MKVESTKVTNMVRAIESGMFYLRARINGRLVWRSLDTDSFTVAKLRLPDELKKLRLAAPPANSARASTSMTFADAVAAFKQSVNADSQLKPAAKKFKLRSELTLKRTWPEVFAMELRRVTPDACEKFLTRFEGGDSRFKTPNAQRVTLAGNSPTTVNALISFLRQVFEVGVKAGVCYQNAAAGLKRRKPRRKLLRLPNKTQFAQMVAFVRGGNRWGRISGDLMEGLAYSGMRLGEAHKLLWEHIDFERGVMTVQGEKTTDSARTVPMTDAFRDLVERIQIQKKHKLSDRVFEGNECGESLAKACKEVGVARMTHHDLRHLFATTCVESGVEVTTLSKWLGHADGGALAMKTYYHLSPAHSVAAVKKVKFA